MRCAPLFLLAAVFPAAVGAQQATQIIRGRVTDTDGRPVRSASVVVTGDQTFAAHSANTDSGGRYRVAFTDGEGQYTVLVRSPGYTPALRRTTMATNGVFDVDVVVGRSAMPLAPLIVRIPAFGRIRADRPSVGGASQDARGDAAFLADPSDINALIGLQPGVVASGDSGYSVMGAGSDQNELLLDGVSFDGTTLPPDAECSVQLATTTSDPSRGQFSGGQTSVSSCRGGEFAESTVRASLTDPALTWSDPLSPVKPARTVLASGFVGGPIRAGVAHFRLSGFARSSSVSPVSLVSRSPVADEQLGLTSDSIDAFTAAVGAVGAGHETASLRGATLNRQLSADLTTDWNMGAATSWLLTTIGTITSDQGIGLSPFAYPSTTSTNTSRNGRIMLRGSTTIGEVTDQLTAAVSGSVRARTPDDSLPPASVTVGTQYPDGGTGQAALRFGGAGVAPRVNTSDIDITNDVSVVGIHHGQRLAFGQALRVRAWRQFTPADPGTYTFRSIADLDTDMPSSYVRLNQQAAASAKVSEESLWFRDIWRLSSPLSIEGGVRADWTQTGTPPPLNSALLNALGAQTDRPVAYANISPRLGFAWLIKPMSAHHVTDRSGHTLTMLYPDFADAAGEARGNAGPGTTLFGNVGIYQGALSPARLAGYRDHTGLDGTTTLSCIGDATPIPNWSTPERAEFSSCRDGSDGTLSTDVPSVQVAGAGYRVPVAWKANLGYNQELPLGGSLQLSAILLRETHTASAIDLNLNTMPQFHLAGELNRPVYVPVGDIVPATGLSGPGASRVSPEWGTVFETISDLHRTAVQANVVADIPRLFGAVGVEAAYSLNIQHAQTRGFDASTGGDPLLVESSTGAAPVHQLVVETDPPMRIWWLQSRLRIDVSSGTGYTPLVASDINGDGLVNDRAFIPSLAGVAGSEQEEFQSLLAGAPSGARNCLDRQEGTIAGPNSCRGPWQVQFDFTLDLQPPVGVGPRRLHLNLTFFNAGATLLRLVGIRGLSTVNIPDDRLLFVTGFDPSTQEYLYHVNAAFGQPLGSGTGHTPFPPFELRLQGSYDLATRDPIPFVHHVGLHPPLRPADLDRVSRTLAAIMPDPVDTLIALADSLALSPRQVTALQGVREQFTAAIDSIAAVDAAALIARGARLVDADVGRRLSPYTALRISARDRALRVLSAAQLAKLASITSRAVR